ncbi:hypothetical protein PCANC_03448 [Puccinia coronata f. sp. avenae]|uniref:Uncharacterized protein n=1 Tax=Puccinia coronata f. sp. avenae TaxID=200324 RepID=A0A2N5W2B2_9BASI|nr:hypothetical protein PCANC_03448 [Puccinia coronata f. sp. avenae]
MSKDFFGANGFLPRSLGRRREEQLSPAPKLSEYGLGWRISSFHRLSFVPASERRLGVRRAARRGGEMRLRNSPSRQGGGTPTQANAKPGRRSAAAKNLAPRTLQPPAALWKLNMIGQTRLNGQHALWLDSACPRSLVEHVCPSTA